MAGNLSTEDTAMRLVRNALDAGEWVEVRDARTGRSCYYNPRTKETTRDLRMTLVRGFDPSAARPCQSPAAGTQPATQRDAGSYTAQERADEVATLRQTLTRYEAELTELRHRVFSAGLERTIYDAPDRKSFKEKADAAEAELPVAVLREQLAAARALNLKLYLRVVQDRERSSLCARCGVDANAEPLVEVAHASLLADANIGFPTSLAPFTANAVDRVLMRAEAEGAGVGYLPSTYFPRGGDAFSHSTLKIQQQASLKPLPPSIVGGTAAAASDPSVYRHPSVSDTGSLMRASTAPSSAAPQSPSPAAPAGAANAAASVPRLVPRSAVTNFALNVTPARSGAVPTSLYDGGLHTSRARQR